MRNGMTDTLSADLLKAGYKPFSDAARHPHSNCAFQKTFYGPKDTRLVGKILYYINVVQWRSPNLNTVSYQADVNFFREDKIGVQRFQTLLYLEDHDTVESMEYFFANMYRTMDCVPDEDNN